MVINSFVCNISILKPWCGINWDVVIAAVVCLGLVLLVMEYLARNTNWPKEVYRKIPHSITGVVAIAVAWFSGNGSIETAAFGMAVICAAYISTYLRISSIHSVSRKTIGTMLYGLVIVILALVYLPQSMYVFSYGMLVLVVPDALAALVGSRWGRQIPRRNKSIGGSTTFFCTTLVLTFCFVWDMHIALSVALVLTLVEFTNQWGIDNVTLPIVGTYLLSVMV